MTVALQTSSPAGDAPRLPVSPYARKLAGERAIALTDIAGSGPGGRIVAADVLAVEPAAVAPPTASAIGAVGALAVSLDIAPLKALLGSIAEAGGEVEAEDAFLRAVLDALAAHPDGSGTAVLIETGDGDRLVTPAARLSLAALRELRLSGGQVAVGEDQTPAALSFRFRAQSGIRSVIAPLHPSSHLRLVVSISRDGETADLLLVHEMQNVDEARAVALLEGVRDAIETPLRLFV